MSSQSRGESTVKIHVCLDVEPGLQSTPPGQGLQEEVDQVGNEKQLERMKVGLAAAAKVFRSEKTWPGKEQTEAAKDFGIKMKEFAQSMREKMADRQIGGAETLLSAVGTKLAGG
jgi:hypothetical protein